MTVTLKLPWPPSINHYWRRWRGRTVLSRWGRSYRAIVAARLAGSECRCTGRLRVEIDAAPPDNRRRDLDNLLKAVLDALQHAGVYDDDGQIDCLLIRRLPPNPDSCLYVAIGANDGDDLGSLWWRR
jgi:crossover junction endodeoxyribonuclease RusA